MLFGCENYVESDVINECISKNDLGIKFKVLVNNEYQYSTEKLIENNPKSHTPIRIKIENKFLISSGLVPVNEGKKYKLRMILSENSAEPILLYSFWESSITQLRYRTFNGKNGNPPKSITQESFSESKIFEEIFNINKNENFLMLRLFCERGEVTINDLSIEEIM